MPSICSAVNTVLEYLEFTQLSNCLSFMPLPPFVLEYLEFTQLSNCSRFCSFDIYVLEYLEFTQLSNSEVVIHGRRKSFRVPGIYTALKHPQPEPVAPARFRVPGIYTALKPYRRRQCPDHGFRVPGIYTALKPWEMAPASKAQF